MAMDSNTKYLIDAIFSSYEDTLTTKDTRTRDEHAYAMVSLSLHAGVGFTKNITTKIDR